MGPNILIAEPETQVAEALALYLHQKLGGVCHVAADYGALVASAHECSPDIVLVSSCLTGAAKDKQLLLARRAAPGARFILLRDDATTPKMALFASDYTVSKAQPILVLLDAILVMLHYTSAPKRGDRKRNVLWARETVKSAARNQVGPTAKKGAR